MTGIGDSIAVIEVPEVDSSGNRGVVGVAGAVGPDGVIADSFVVAAGEPVDRCQGQVALLSIMDTDDGAILVGPFHVHGHAVDGLDALIVQ